MRNSLPNRLRRRWPLLVLTGTVAGGATLGVLRVQSLVREQLPGLLKDRLEAALGRPVQFGQLRFLPTGIWIEQFRVVRQAGEREDPLAAYRLRASVDWWHLLTARQVRVSGVDLDRARFRLAPEASGQPWTARLAGLSHTGVERFTIRDASLHLLAAANGPDAWRAEGVTGNLTFRSTGYRYQARVRSVSDGKVAVTKLRLAGAGDEESVRLDEVEATYRGARLQGRGTVRSSENTVAMKVRVRDLSLREWSSQIGIPAEWAVKGRVTGELTVDARNNLLRGLQGRLRVDRGSLTREGSVFPWRSATGDVTWTPEKSSLRNVKVSGDGVELTLNGDVATGAGQPFTAGRFHAAGQVTARGPEPVSRVASLLAFRRVLNGRWQADRAAIGFQADGTVGDLASATATGRIRLDTLQLRPEGQREPVTVAQLEADLERTPSALALTHLKAQTDGLTVNGGFTLTDAQPGRPGTFAADGSVEVRDVNSLRKAIPTAALWRWLPADAARASGRLSFRLGGPAAQPMEFWSDGTFEVRDFQVGAQPSTPDGSRLTVPVELARGTFHHEARRLSLTDLELKAPALAATGRLDLGFETEDPTLATALHVTSEEWRRLPGVPEAALPGLAGGRLAGDVTLAAPFSRLAAVPVEGSFRLAGASYALREGVSVPIREVGGRFRWTENLLELPALSLDSTLLSAEASGRLAPAEQGYSLTLDGSARTEDTGALARYFGETVRVAGGRSGLKFHLDTPLDRLQAAALTGSLHLEDATLVQAPGLTDAARSLVGRDGLTARTLDVEFARGADRWNVERLALETSTAKLALKGALTGRSLDAEVELHASGWNAPARVPVAGGALTLKGRLTGDTTRLENLAFAGDASLDGGKARYASARGALKGGSLRIEARGEGPLSDLAQWARSGQVTLTGARARWSERPAQRVDLAARFSRKGEGFLFTDGRASLGGIRVTGAGEWLPTSYRLDLSASAADLKPLGLALPEGVAAREYRVRAALTGSAERLLQSASGRLEADGLRLALKGAPAQAFEHAAGDFRYADERLWVENLEGRGPAGTLSASGDWTRDGHHLSLSAKGDDLARLGLALPEGIGARGYEVQADLRGTAKQPLAGGTGRVRLADAWFSFGPQSPHRLATVSSRFTLDGGRVLLQDLAGEGPAGRFTGKGELSGKGYGLALEIPRLEPAVARWLVPGTVTGGALAGTLQIAGSGERSVASLGGHFELRDAGYRPPSELKLSGAPLRVARFAGDYRWDGSRTTLTGLALSSDLVNGTGSFSTSAAGTDLKADLTTADLGRVTELWPQAAGVFRGGSATGQVAARWDTSGAKGTVGLQARGGMLILPGVPEDLGENPVDQASLTLGFSPERLVLTDVRVRGPRGNMDASGEWTVNGPVSGSGKAWYTREYSKKLIKPSGWGWLAPLIGIRDVKSDFKIGGTASRVTLDAGITRTFMWKFARKRVPKEFQDVAKGKAPLWVAPVELAQQPGADSPKP